jgi:hypothetical protein
MTRAATAFVPTPAELALTLCWIDDLLNRDTEVARGARKHNDFSTQLMNVRATIQRQAFAEAEQELDAILETFAIVQAIVFTNRVAERG